MTTIISNYGVISSIVADTYAASITPTGADISGYEGDLLVHLSIGTATDGTITPALQHNDVATSGDSGWAAVPAEALRDPATGDNDTFTAINTGASQQTLEVVRHRLKRYVRVSATVAGSWDGEVCAVLFGLQKYPS